MNLPPFEEFPKIPRLNRTISITEKIDGTNAQIYIGEDGSVYAGSRNRWLTPGNDNAGFRVWVEANSSALRETLGPGRHYGEWWGSGIQRRYGLNHKRFSLFNTHRWGKEVGPNGMVNDLCYVVPELYVGQFSQSAITEALDTLTKNGSLAAPGFMDPEGVVVYMHASGTMHKVLRLNDELPKGLVPYAEKQLQEKNAPCTA